MILIYYWWAIKYRILVRLTEAWDYYNLFFPASDATALPPLVSI